MFTADCSLLTDVLGVLIEKVGDALHEGGIGFQRFDDLDRAGVVSARA